MKKNYMKPNMEIVELKGSQYLLAGSLDIDQEMVIPGNKVLAPGIKSTYDDDLDFIDIPF